MIKAIIFDFDGVLVESVDIKTRAFTRLFESEGEGKLNKIIEYHLRNAGVSRFEKFRYIFKFILKRELTDSLFKELCRHFRAIVVDEVIKVPYVLGAEQFLNNYYGCYKYFVSSATPEKEITEIIKKRKMFHLFSGIYGAPRKKADIVKEIIRNNKLRLQDVVYVGDALSDFEAARDNSINFVARMNRNESLFCGIDCVRISDLTELDEVLKLKFG
jgi:HAD superfamily hydrolase (TIGR01549 family)